MEFHQLWKNIEHWFEVNEYLIQWLGIISVIMFIGTLIVVPLLIVKLPQDFLELKKHTTSHSWLKLGYVPYLILKNLLGVILVIAGIAMLVLPGQGILTIIIGLTLVNFPGKHKLICGILIQKKIRRSINNLRSRFNRPPLDLPEF
ncbi:MAG: hypothetical protein GY874_10695 [Desulfobacteraceae bacterium]|nr:hypothetical protein [Desulfobacteraceae bacterium]